jgi:tetratricopeptide (TPR) repeat protein
VPEHGILDLERGHCAMEMGEETRDETRSDTVIPPAASSLLEAGMKEYAHGRYQSAYDLLHRAVEVDPGECWAWLYLGNACGWLDREAEAGAAYERAIVAAGEDSYCLGWIYRFRGHYWRTQGDLPRAAQDYERSASQGDEFMYGPGSAEEVFLYAAEVYEQLGDYQHAIDALESYGVYGGNQDRATSERERLETLRNAQQ